MKGRRTWIFTDFIPDRNLKLINIWVPITAVAAVVLWILGLDGCRAVNYFYVAGIAVLNSLWIAALYLLVNVLTNLEEYKGLWKELCRWLKMRSMR